MEGRKGEKSRALKVYDLEQRRLIDAEITKRSVGFMERSVQAKKPFFVFVSLTAAFPYATKPRFRGEDWQRGLGRHACRDGSQCWPNA